MRLLVASVVLAVSCTSPLLASPTPAPSPLPVVELKYRVFEEVGRPWYCDPDFFPVARADEKDLARERLPEMQRDAETYGAILRHNGIGAAASVTDEQLLVVYRDWKDLRALELGPTGVQGAYGTFQLFRAANVDKQGERVDLRISQTGRITVIHREAAGPPNCPICLADTTAIDTPLGPVRVTALRVGDVIWSRSATGTRVAAPLVAVGSVDAPAGHEIVRIELQDRRVVTASPGHPTTDGRVIGDLEVGTVLDGSIVRSIERIPYRGRTYDVLPAGPTGAYWADGVLLGSTLRR